MKAIQFEQAGDAGEVLQLVDVPEPGAPAGGRALVATLYSPLNHHDLGFIAGVFGVPPLPAVPGNEGVGRVLELGDGVTGLSVGDVVVYRLLQGAWRERLLLDAEGLAVLPAGDLAQFSMLGSNTPTAGLALSEYVPLAAGDWVVQSAGNGGVGRNVIALAKARGLRTVSIVRRPEVVDELLAAGADAVLVDGPDLAGRIRAAAGGEPIGLAIDGVGGSVADAFVDVLADNGALIGYGSYSGETGIPDAAATRGVTFHRIFVGAFDYATKIVPVINEAVPLIQAGKLVVPVEAVFSLGEHDQAVAHLKQGGKVLFKISE